MATPKYIPLGDDEVTVSLNDWTEGNAVLKSDLLDDIGTVTNDDFSIVFQRKYEVHGGFEKNSVDDATLLVLKIIPKTSSGRVFKHLRVQLVFEKAPGIDPDDDDPYIVAYEPGQEGEQKFGDQITKVTKGTNTQFSASGQAPGSSATASKSWSDTGEFERHKLHKLSSGSSRSETRLKKKNLVWWELEAAEESNGVGDHIVVAVLIQRASGSEFAIKVDTKAGFGGFKDAFDKVKKPFKKRKVVFLGLFNSAPRGAEEQIPRGVSKNELHAASTNDVLKTLAYVHVPEQVATATLYKESTTSSSPSV